MKELFPILAHSGQSQTTSTCMVTATFSNNVASSTCGKGAGIRCGCLVAAVGNGSKDLKIPVGLGSLPKLGSNRVSAA